MDLIKSTYLNNLVIITITKSIKFQFEISSQMKLFYAVLLSIVWSVPTKPGSPSDSLTAPKRTIVPEPAGAPTVEPPTKKQCPTRQLDRA